MSDATRHLLMALLLTIIGIYLPFVIYVGVDLWRQARSRRRERDDDARQDDERLRR